MNKKIPYGLKIPFHLRILSRIPLIGRIFRKKIEEMKEKRRQELLKILLTALHDSGILKIDRRLFIYLCFLIDHYLDRKLSAEPRVFGYNYYVYK